MSILQPWGGLGLSEHWLPAPRGVGPTSEPPSPALQRVVPSPALQIAVLSPWPGHSTGHRCPNSPAQCHGSRWLPATGPAAAGRRCTGPALVPRMVPWGQEGPQRPTGPRCAPALPGPAMPPAPADALRPPGRSVAPSGGRPAPPALSGPAPHYTSHRSTRRALLSLVGASRLVYVTSGLLLAAMLAALRCCGPRSFPVAVSGAIPAWSPWLVPSRGRKSRHDPPAKSKASRLKVPPPVDPAELYVVTERYRQHRLVLSALRSIFRSEVVQRKRKAQRDAEDTAALSEEHRLLMAWNDAENARQRARREERIRKEEEERKVQKLRAAENKAKVMEAFLKEKEKEVLQLQEEAKTFITPENLEARIEECLDNPRNYNFAIDKEGRIVKRTALS
ncbi:28S ribosomal protein S26, mitochondrial [Numida meleagris]|uniref:28S ribosomal protein S26, mitochondrial n=1 Tax=Numida meleagris TaxID=8996 RepID=UPI000B3DFA7E|nr:28S ribosomal protein S26, mitochondrial [Numida meleagris]